MNLLGKLIQFKKVKWEEIPDQGLYSTQLIDFIEAHLITYFPEIVTLTPNMINNYVKKDIIPKPINKKYYREHIAVLMVVVILKELIPLESIKEGITLQLNIIEIEQAYNEFMDLLESSLKEVNALVNDSVGTELTGIRKETLSLSIAVKAFAFQAVTREILKAKGIYKELS